jgi:hypothetical protein
MSYGIQFFNTNNNIVLSAEVPVPYFIGKATKVPGSEAFLIDLSTTFSNGLIIRYPDQVATFTMEIFSPAVPIVFLRVSSVTYSSSGAPLQGAAIYSVERTNIQNNQGWYKYLFYCVSTYPGQVGQISPSRNTNSVIAYCFASPIGVTPPDTTGIALYNANNEQMFHSGLKPLTIRGLANIPLPNFSPSAVPVPHNIPNLTNPATISFANTGFQDTQSFNFTGGGCYTYTSCFIDVSTGASGCTQEIFCNLYSVRSKLTQRFRLWHEITPTAIAFSAAGTGGEVENPLIPDGFVPYQFYEYLAPVIEGSDYD